MAAKKGKLLIALTLVSLTSAVLAFGPQGGGPGYGGGARMAQELNLTVEQQQQVQELMKKHREEGRQWREQHRKDMEIKLGGVLTPEQLEKFKSIKKQRSSGRRDGSCAKGKRP